MRSTDLGMCTYNTFAGLKVSMLRAMVALRPMEILKVFELITECIEPRYPSKVLKDRDRLQAETLGTQSSSADYILKARPTSAFGSQAARDLSRLYL